MSIKTPWVIDTNNLEKRLNEKDLLVIDMTKKDSYLQAHIPGAVFLDYAKIVKHAPPIVGMLPEPEQFSQALSDDEGGGKAARLMWTMEIAGHQKMSLLDGGIHAWLNDNKALSDDTPVITSTTYPINFNDTTVIADADYIMSNLEQNGFCILDTRSKNEFIGTDKRSAKAGHIPGAINLDWLDIKSAEDAQRLKSPEHLENMLSELGLSPDQEIITHCHSHHRSALMYVVLKSLGYNKVKGYPASWSDWAARNDTPVEI